MEIWWHVFEDQSPDPVWTCGLVVRASAESFSHDRGDDPVIRHRDGGGGGWANIVQPREWCSGGECGVRGKSHPFDLRKLRYNLRWGCNE